MSNVKSFSETRNLIIFTDPGIDDSIAIREILTNVPKGINIFICPVAGNAPADITLRNARIIANERVNAIFDGTMIDTNEVEICQEYVGDDGLGGYTAKNSKLTYAPVVPLAEYKTVMDLNLPTDVIAIAPFRVISGWLTQFLLDFKPKYIKNIYIMGGCDKRNPGNMGEGDNSLEFNQYIDPTAYALFMGIATTLNQVNSTKLHIATLESCENERLDLMNYKFAPNQIDTMEQELFDIGRELAKSRGEESYFVYDLTIAWKYLMDIGVYKDSFIKKSMQLKGIDYTSTDVIMPYTVFDNPWDSKLL